VQQAASGIGRRNLRGRCGGSRVGKRKPPHPRHDEPFRALASVRGRRRSTRRKKRRAPLDCKATSRWEEPSDEESTAGDQRGERKAPTTRRVPGRWKASWLPRRHSPSRGKPRRGPRSVRHAEGTPPFRPHAARLPRGARFATEEGNLPTLPHGSSVKETGYLRSGQIGPCSHIAIASPILGATDGGLEAPPRTRRHEERWPSVPYLPADLYCSGDGDDGASLARCPPFLGRERAIACRARRKRRTGSGGQRIGTGSS